jgi:cytochrome b subunit of formate dehydrogenase
MKKAHQPLLFPLMLFMNQSCCYPYRMMMDEEDIQWYVVIIVIVVDREQLNK